LWFQRDFATALRQQEGSLIAIGLAVFPHTDDSRVVGIRFYWQ
jgi:hypothetical protein